MKQRLSPCPFCGGEAAFGQEPGGDGRYVECRQCHASSTMMRPEKCDVAGLLAEHWNRRQPAPPGPKAGRLLAELETIRDMAGEDIRCGRAEGTALFQIEANAGAAVERRGRRRLKGYRYYFAQDSSGHWYLLPTEWRERFRELDDKIDRCGDMSLTPRELRDWKGKIEPCMLGTNLGRYSFLDPAQEFA